MAGLFRHPPRPQQRKPFLSPPSAYELAVLADSPAGYWRLGETSGTVAVNAEGTAARNGTYTGTYTQGATGLLIDNADKALSVGGAGWVFVPSWTVAGYDTVSIEAWVKWTSGNGVIVSRGTNGYAVETINNNGTIQFADWNIGPICQSTVTLTSGVTTHIVVTKNGATSSKIWINGVDRTGTVTNQTFIHDWDELGIGADRAGGNFFNGVIDEVAIYPTVLSEARVQAHFVAGGGQIVALGLISQTATIAAPAVYQGYPAAVMVDSPSAYYRLGDASGPTVTAVVGNNLTADASPTFGVAGLLTGDADTAMTFVQASLQYLYGSDSGMPTGNNPWTAEAWIKTSSAAEQEITLWGTDPTAVGFGIYVGRPAIIDANYFNPFGSTHTIDDNVRHHVALTWDGTTFRCYKDGVQLGSNWVPGANNNIVLGGAGRLLVGVRNANSFDGTMDEVAIYPTALSAARLLAHYNAGISGPQSITAGLISQTATISAPTVTTQTAVSVGLITQTATIAAPTVNLTIYANFINQTATISAPTVTPGAAPVSIGLINQTAQIGTPTITTANVAALGLITQTATIAAPTITQSATVAPNFIDQTATISAPTITTGNVNVTPNLITQTAAISAPAITTANAISVGLINQTATISAPTITTANAISVGLINQAAATFTPSVTTSNAILIGLISQTASASAPTITTGAVAASVGLIDQTAQPRTPTITTAAFVSVGLISSTAAALAPTVGTDIALGLITQTAATFAPTVTSLATVSVGLISQTATASTPTVTPGAASVVLGLIDQTAAANAPTVTAGGAVVELGLISQTATAFSPTITTGAVSVAPNFIDQTATISSPSVTTANTISFALIDRTATASSPTITTGAVPVSIGLIDQTAATFTPTVTTGAVNVVLGLISQAAATSAPTLITSNSILLGLINQTATANAPIVTPGVTLGLINQAAQIHAPTITVGAAFVSLGLIDRTAVANAPAVQIISGLEMDLITQTATTFTPSITTANTISVAPISQAATTFSPTIIPGTVELTLGLIAQTALALEPEIVPTYALPLDLITQTAGAFAPTLVYDQFMVLARINRKAVAYVPYVGPEEVPDSEGGLAYVGGGYYG